MTMTELDWSATIPTPAKGVFLVKTKNAFVPVARDNSVNTYSRISTVPRGSERSERSEAERCRVSELCEQINIASAGKHYLDTFVKNDMYTFLLKSSREEPHRNVVKQLDYTMGQKTIWNP